MSILSQVMQTTVVIYRIRLEFDKVSRQTAFTVLEYFVFQLFVIINKSVLQETSDFMCQQHQQ